jgi:hypothetical protein
LAAGQFGSIDGCSRSVSHSSLISVAAPPGGAATTPRRVDLPTDRARGLLQIRPALKRRVDPPPGMILLAKGQAGTAAVKRHEPVIIQDPQLLVADQCLVDQPRQHRIIEELFNPELG